MAGAPSALTAVPLHASFFFGKNNLMMVAFGREPQDEYRKGTHKISQVALRPPRRPSAPRRESL